MFDLEQAIGSWRRELADGGIESTDMLDELEGHLREDIEMQREANAATGVEEVFAIAVHRMGDAHALRTEFHKNAGSQEARERLKHVLYTLAGIPAQTNPSLMIASSSPTVVEPRWATYLKASAFILPAACAWTFSSVFLFPKFREICQKAGMAIPPIYQVTSFLVEHGVVILAGMIAIFVLLERRSNQWPQYRRATIGIGVFLLNAAVLVLITLMVLFALVAAPVLMRHSN
jgi:hypothetical protein